MPQGISITVLSQKLTVFSFLFRPGRRPARPTFDQAKVGKTHRGIHQNRLTTRSVALFSGSCGTLRQLTDQTSSSRREQKLRPANQFWLIPDIAATIPESCYEGKPLLQTNISPAATMLPMSSSIPQPSHPEYLSPCHPELVSGSMRSCRV